MKYLLYCIFNRPDQKPWQNLTGIEIVSHDTLAAVVCARPGPVPPFDIASLQAYRQIVEYFNHRQTIIPMRYGCLFGDKKEIARHLAENRDVYTDLLDELKGCVEMGIRILTPQNRSGPKPHAAALHKGPHPISGKAYLTLRKAHYESTDRDLKESEQIAAQIGAAFSECCVRYKTESGRGSGTLFQDQLLSLYFLVRRGSVEPFRDTFRHLSHCNGYQLLLSGPWPPYNFVTPDQAQGPT